MRLDTTTCQRFLQEKNGYPNFKSKKLLKPCYVAKRNGDEDDKMTDRHEGNRMRLPKVGRGMFVRSGRQVVNVSSLFPSSAVKRASYGILVRKEIMTYGDEGAGQRSAIAGYSGEIV